MYCLIGMGCLVSSLSVVYWKEWGHLPLVSLPLIHRLLHILLLRPGLTDLQGEALYIFEKRSTTLEVGR